MWILIFCLSLSTAFNLSEIAVIFFDVLAEFETESSVFDPFEFK